MEAKDKNLIWLSDEMEFFTLIEKKLEEKGFEVLETLPPDKPCSDMIASNRKQGDRSMLVLTSRFSRLFVY